MELNIHISPNVIKRLNALKRGGRNASQAAEHARKIMDQTLEGICTPKQIGRLTRYGEARIPNCIKFDLTGGYRLVAVIGKREISFLYVGSHDECDHWAKNNAGLESRGDNRTTASVRVCGGKDGARPSSEVQAQEDCMEVDDHDAELLRDLSDGDLRKIFCGLCGRRT